MDQMRRRRRTLLVALAAVVLAGCGSGEAASPSGSPSTVGNVGHLPGELSHGTSPAPAPSTTTGSNAAATPTTTSSATGGTDGPSAAPSASVPGHIGDLTDGDHLFILGDSILEATTPEYGGLMCSSLLPHGWTVETDAQTGRDAAGGLQALEDRIDQGEQWDASIVMLGNNYRDDPDQFDEQLGEILDLLSPDPVLLLTVTEFEDIQAQVNEVIRTEAAKRDNVRLLDWAARTANDDSLVGDDGLHLTDKGRVAIVAMIRLALGDAPIGSLGQCRDS
jgi:lysophospholipase L1-like esterase